METHDLPRHQIIKNLILPLTGNVADEAISLWERLATNLIYIIGDDGFNSLYARSIYLNQPKFYWLDGSLQPSKINLRFTALKIGLQGQTPAQASEANILLLITFTNILASLIGEQLTMSILGVAWGVDISNTTGKEFKNE